MSICSHIGDGICDCCDGSDEDGTYVWEASEQLRKKINCPDRCAAERDLVLVSNLVSQSVSQLVNMR